ncbi:MAG: hypothetical protein QM605_10730 [Sphingobium sp.]
MEGGPLYFQPVVRLRRSTVQFNLRGFQTLILFALRLSKARLSEAEG